MNLPPPSAAAVTTLTTLGGTVLEVGGQDANTILGGSVEYVTPPCEPPTPPTAWLIFGLGLGALVLAARRGCETSPAPRARLRPASFRSQPMEA